MRPRLNSTFFRLLGDIQEDISLPSSYATQVSQVVDCASSAAIWHSVFEIVNPSLPTRSAPASPIPTEAILGVPNSSEVILDFPDIVPEGLLPPTPIHLKPTGQPPYSAPTLKAKSRNTPIKPNAGTYTTQTGIYTEVDPRLRALLKRLTFPNTPGFMDAFFSSYQSKAKEILQLKQFTDLRCINEWTKFPHPVAPTPFEMRFLGLVNQVLTTIGVSHSLDVPRTASLT